MDAKKLDNQLQTYLTQFNEIYETSDIHKYLYLLIKHRMEFFTRVEIKN